MLNRIRRTFTLTRARYSSRGRHRRALTPSCPPASPLASHESAGVPTPFLGWATVDVAPHRTLLRGKTSRSSARTCWPQKGAFGQAR